MNSYVVLTTEKVRWWYATTFLPSFTITTLGVLFGLVIFIPPWPCIPPVINTYTYGWPLLLYTSRQQKVTVAMARHYNTFQRVIIIDSFLSLWRIDIIGHSDYPIAWWPVVLQIRGRGGQLLMSQWRWNAIWLLNFVVKFRHLCVGVPLKSSRRER